MRPLVTFACVILYLLGVSLPVIAAPPQIEYTVTMTRPWTHLLEVEMRVTGLNPAERTTDLSLPLWTPGSYLVREYARNVQDFSALNETGKIISWAKTRKNIWRIEKGGTSALTVRYQVYANVFAVQQAEVTDTHAFWNNATALMHIANRRDVPSTVVVKPPQGWKVATGLTLVPGKQNVFSAPDLDTLYDCPIEVSNFVEVKFQAMGKPHRIVIDGTGNYDPERLKKDLGKLVETQAAMLGGLPYDNYTFILHLRGGGGLEHKNSTALGYSANGFKPDNVYRNFLGLASHEFFHLWNVKRIKPDALGPFDYDNENYTRLLWVAEGITSYYTNRHLLRAGFLSAEDYLRSVASDVAGVERTPGRLKMSLEEASFDAWIKYYRPDENALNSSISYYGKGSVVGMLLDLTIRQKTNGAKSLDDVMRTLWTDYALKNKNYTPQDFQKICEATAGGSLDAFFARSVRGREELDYDAAFAAVGLRLQRVAEGADGKPLPSEAYLGAGLAADPLGAKVTALPSDSPAYEQALMVGDVIIAVDDQRLTTPDILNDRIREKKAGDAITLTLFRFDVLKTMTLRLGSRPRPDYRLVPLRNASPSAKDLYKGWTNEKFPDGNSGPVGR